MEAPLLWTKLSNIVHIAAGLTYHIRSLLKMTVLLMEAVESKGLSVLSVYKYSSHS